jgi:hypothetical protein
MAIRWKTGAISVLVFVLGFQASSVSAEEKYRTSNGMRVWTDTSDPSRFDVLQLAGRGGPDYWCAAGRYVIERRGMPNGTRIFLVQPLGRGRLNRNSIGFSVNPDIATGGGGTNRVTMSTNDVGQNWSAEHARTQCPVKLRGR